MVSSACLLNEQSTVLASLQGPVVAVCTRQHPWLTSHSSYFMNSRGMLHAMTSYCFSVFVIFLLSLISKVSFPLWKRAGPRSLKGPANTAFAFQPVMSLARHARGRPTKTVWSAKWAGHVSTVPVWVRRAPGERGKGSLLGRLPHPQRDLTPTCWCFLSLPLSGLWKAILTAFVLSTQM